MQKILTVGVFDYFHYGHLKLFLQAKQLCPDSWLIVAVQEGSVIKKYKPDADIFYSTEIRKEMIRALSCVDEVISYTDVNKIVREIDFDVFAVGEDQKHQGFLEAIEYCKQNNKKVASLKRTPDICSSFIKKHFVRRK